MSQGELWRASARVGKESAYNTAVAPTRRLYLAPGSGLAPGGTTTRYSVQTGDRAQVRSAAPGVTEPSGTFSLAVESGEILEFLEMGMNGTPAVTTPATATTTRLHTYTAPGTPASGTVQFHDGALPWQQSGVYVNTMRIEGAANGDLMLSGDLFGATHTQTALSGTVTDRSPVPFSGWESQLFIDPVGAGDTYGTTLIAGPQSVVNYSLPLCENGLQRLYTSANTRAMQAAILGVFEATGSLTFKAVGARALTEYNDFVAGTQKRIRMRFGDNLVLEGALKSYVDVDIQVVWTEFNLLGEEAGVRTYEASFAYVYDSVNALAARVACQNSRTASF